MRAFNIIFAELFLAMEVHVAIPDSVCLLYIHVLYTNIDPSPQLNRATATNDAGVDVPVTYRISKR